MSQLWALVAPDGTCALRFTGGLDQHPAEHGHGEECEGLAVWPIEREPRRALGEGVDPDTGSIDFRLDRIEAELVTGIKAEAGRRIEAVAPLWRQLNDLNEPSAPGAAARAAAIAAIRTWSNEAETMLLKASDADGLEEILSAIKSGWPA